MGRLIRRVVGLANREAALRSSKPAWEVIVSLFANYTTSTETAWQKWFAVTRMDPG